MIVPAPNPAPVALAPEDSPGAPEPFIISATQRSDWRRCKRLWWLKKVARLPEVPSRALIFGDRFAACLDRWFSGVDPFPEGLSRVVSGGQTGVDAAGLRAAQAAGVPTGGWAPKGWRTLDGPSPVLMQWGLREHESEDYAERTRANVRDSSGTLRIAEDFLTQGEILTSAEARHLGRPVFDVVVGPDGTLSRTPEDVRAWIKASRVGVLNVAGNSEQSAPGIGALAEGFLRRVFEGLFVPERWDDGLFPVEADLARRLVADAEQVKPRKRGGRTAAVLERRPGQAWEVTFSLPVLDGIPDVLEGVHPTPPVLYTGRLDLLEVDGVVDHKTTASWGWVLDAEGLRGDGQLLAYARAFLDARRERGVPDPSLVRVRHNTFCKKDGATDFAEAWVSPADVDAEWEKVKEDAHSMRALRDIIPATDAETFEMLPRIPPAEVDKKRILTSRSSACGKYNGCPFREICGGVRTPEQHRNIVNAQLLSAGGDVMIGAPLGFVASAPTRAHPIVASATSTIDPTTTTSPGSQGSEGDQSMSIFATRNAGATATPNGSAGMSPAPFAAPPAAQGLPPAAAPGPLPQAPPAAAGFPAPPAPPPAQSGPPPVGTVHPHAPPWTRADDIACRISPENVINTGVSTVGDPCIICKGRQEKVGGPHPGMFDYGYQAGNFWWRAKAEFQAMIAALAPGKVEGAIAAPWVRLPGTPAPQAAPAAAPPAPAQAPATPPPTAFAPAPLPPAAPAHQAPPQAPAAPPAAFAPAPPAQAPPPTPAPQGAPAVPSPAAPSAAAADGKGKSRAAKGFTLFINVAKVGGGSSVQLDEVFGKYSAEFFSDWKGRNPLKLDDAGRPIASFFQIPYFERRDGLAAVASLIVSVEKFGTRDVFGNTSTQDMAEFTGAFRSLADDVYVGTRT